MSGPLSTPSVQQFVSNESADGLTIGRVASSLVGFHGTASVQQAAASTPIDLATALTAIIAINLTLKNKGLTP